MQTNKLVRGDEAMQYAWAKSIQIKFNEQQHSQIVYAFRIHYTSYAILPWILNDDSTQRH